MEALRSKRIQEALSKKRGEIRRVPPTSSQPTTAIQACLQAAAAADDSVSGRSGRFSMPGLLATRMEALLGDERFADIVVAIGGCTFPCHRAVLAAVGHTGSNPGQTLGRPATHTFEPPREWSGFFDTMLSGEWAEASAREVTIDLPADGFDELLGFATPAG